MLEYGEYLVRCVGVEVCGKNTLKVDSFRAGWESVVGCVVAPNQRCARRRFHVGQLRREAVISGCYYSP